MNLMLFCIIFLAIFTETLVSTLRRKLFRQKTNIPDLGNGTSNCELWSEIIPSEIDCGRACYKDDRCVKFRYEENGNCSAFCDKDADIGVRQGDSSDVYVIVKDVGYPCDVDEQCILANSSCNNGLCVCNVGYSYRPNTNACAIGCGEYGTTFFSYPEIVLAAYNIIEEGTNASLADCKQSCIETPECKSIDFKILGYPTCKMNNAGWLEVPVDYRLKYAYSYVYLQRNCYP